ncbi:MAG TPA: folylpolyglutamate synthase/dihydrofolate synthase family protein [Bryobacteraceae bacterium]|nr:folylpolyglutamate synthase/dihydrofolate synthase family protein [Bryobacteraceae bacterium]
MNYAESVQFLYSLGNEVQTAKLGLERITRLLDALGNPQNTFRSVHVAGTNGKGSTCAMIEAGLRAAGVRTALYISPHLVEPTERIQVGGQPVSRQRFADAFQQVHEGAESLLAAGEIDFHPTYFETVTAMAFLVFAQEHVDTAVLEVGLGGRLDATNVVHPALCVITRIDYDHQIFLGNTLAQIAGEKAGILKPGVPAVFSEQAPEAEAVLRTQVKGPYTFTRDCPISNLVIDARGSRFSLGDLNVICPLAGEHQVENARTAAIALERLGVPPDGIASARWPGRLERVSEAPEIILDGAHNPGGVAALVRYIRRFYASRRIWIVYGALRDKAIAEMTPQLFPLAQRIILTAPANSRALAPKDIPAPGATITHSVGEALALLHQADPADAIFITGSLFVVGEARALLVK